METNSKLTYKKPTHLRRRLIKRLSELRPLYKAAVVTDGADISEWLRDNYYLLEREGRSAIRSLKFSQAMPHGDKRTPEIFDICKKAISDDIEGSLRREIEAAKRPITTQELQSLPFMLKAALVDTACICAKNREEYSAQMMGLAITALRSLPSIDFEQIIEDYSRTEKIFARDPSGAYTAMDEKTRAIYRSKCTELALRKGCDEAEIAEHIVKLAQSASKARERHIGFYLLEDSSYKARRIRGNIFLTLRFIIPLIVSAAVSCFSHVLWLLPIIYFPVFEICRPVIDFLATKGVKPTYLPRMELKGHVPASAPTLVTISTLIPSPDKADRLYKRLEQLYRTNCQGEIKFCVLCDLKEYGLPNRPEDSVSISAVSRVIKSLNEKYDNRFILVIRPRVEVKTQRAFAGYERKRGAITELIRYIHTGVSPFRVIEGDVAFLRRVKYMLALDADTELLMDTAAEMVAAAMHPLNTPVVGEQGCVTDGYGIIAPSVVTSLKSSAKTPFSVTMSGSGGVTTYDTVSGDIYQDLYGQSIFSGKGLIDTDAYYRCLDKAFPDERILSHDILEGSYLRTAYMSDIEMTDECPSGVLPYLKRLHRWIRGDWQNILWLFKRVPSSGGKVGNPINGLSKHMLFDNLRRSATPVFALLCLLLTFFIPSHAAMLTVAALLSAAAPGIFAALRSLIGGGIQMMSRKYYSRVMPSALESLAGALIESVILIQTSLISLSAICAALYRQFVSHRNLLQWTTAADSEGAGGFLGSLVFSLPAVILGVLLFFVNDSFTRLMACFAIVSPFVIYFTSLKWKPKAVQISDSERDTIKAWAASMWRFYDELAGEQDNFLPPDNIQESPVHAVAHRTSPTNIGLMLLCTLAARDFGFIDTANMCLKIERALCSIEKLEKWNGNLLNWYDTKTLQPLKPRFVSTVDSGNFACCLSALSEGLKEYMPESTKIPQIIDRLEHLTDDTDLSPFYNKRRRLFHIGYDLESGSLSTSYYDLLMSEARMTSYFAIASRQVSKKHWGYLGRTLAKQGGYTGPVSWTGTMFEYFMPQLLLPTYENSLGFEALRFCIHCQRSRARAKDAPWGCSESAFYAFDPHYNYQYKAHGVQKLGLKRGLNQEYVVSPYSSFLTLPTIPQSAVKNLLRLEEMGMTGRYGFYEAADFTKSRAESCGYSIVRCYMAHHIGMSIVASCNALYGNIMQKRFMNSRNMLAAKELLEEKIPAGASVFDDISEPEVPQKPGRMSGEVETFDNINVAEPRMHLLSNGQYTLAVTDSGCGVSFSQGADVYRRSCDYFRRPLGFFAVVETDSGSFSITRAPDYSSGAEYSAQFAATHAAFYASKFGIDAGMMICLHPSMPCEERKFIIKNGGQQAKSASLLLYFEPCLSAFEDDAAHPAFSRLFIRCRYVDGLNIVTMERRSRKGEPVLHAAAGFIEGIPFEYSFDREQVLKRPLGTSSLVLEKPALNGESGIPDPCVAARVKVNIAPKSQKQLAFVITCASTQEEAVSRLITCRRQGALSSHKAAASPLFDGGLASRICASILPRLFYPAREKGQSDRYPVSGGIASLWSAGVSGDFPIVLAEVKNADDIGKWEPYIKLHSKMRLCGIKFDLCLLFGEGGDYMRPVSAALYDMIRMCGSEELLGRRGGIYCLDEVKLSKETLSAIKAAASFIAPQNIAAARRRTSEYRPIEILPAARPAKALPSGIDISGGVFCESGGGSFTVADTPKLPWCQVLANENFGTLLSDISLGYTWAKNSRENKLTPWFNDTRTDNRGELLIARINGKYYDLLWGSRVTYTRASALYEGSIGAVDYSVRVTVPKSGMTKVIEVTYSRPEGIETAYYTEPVLGVGGTAVKSMCFSAEGGVLSIHNGFNTAAPGYMCISASGGPVSYVCEKRDFLSGRWDGGNTISPTDPCGAAVVRQSSTHLTFALSFSETPSFKYDILSEPEESGDITEIKISTSNRLLDCLINTWLPSQIEQSRIMGRTAFYQCGGAYGFRDQLQDVCAQMIWNPAAAKEHILRCCAHQFEEGDVLHWWHPLSSGDAGVRTRGSDDMLFLPYTVYEYIDRTADTGILHSIVPFLKGEPLSENEQERYFAPQISDVSGTVYEHCLRAVSTIKLGAHGLPLIGAFDWNDGFSKVGIKGQGESVWLAQFAAIVCERTASLAMQEKQNDTARELLEKAAQLKENVDRHAWNGSWYLRAFYDDGRPMGAAENAECRIDILPQSFCAISNMPDKERRRLAMDSALKMLVDRDAGIVRLFTPPFEHDDPGYIRGYPPGVRENGGQYTHGAVWFVIALLKEGRADEAYSLLRMMSPAEKYLDKRTAEIYKTEPYAITADVYGCPEAGGRGGWSLYTGAASWYYRAVLSYMLGISIRGNNIYINPSLPSQLPEYTARISSHGSVIRLSVKTGEENKMTVDGKETNDIVLDGNEHHVTVITDNKTF